MESGRRESPAPEPGDEETTTSRWRGADGWSALLTALVVGLGAWRIVSERGSPSVWFAVIAAVLLLAWMRRRAVRQLVALRLRTKEEAARTARRERIFESIFERLEDIVVVADAQRRMLHVNAAFVRQFGYTASEVVGQPSAGLYADPEEHAALGRTLFAYGSEIPSNALFEARYRRKDGSTFVGEGRISRILDTDGTPLGVVGVYRDVTLRREELHALRESREQMASFVRDAPQGIAMLDRDMNYIAASARWLTDFGMADGDATGISLYVQHPDIPAAWRDVHQRSLAGERLENREDTWVHADGSVRWTAWSSVPWRQPDGRIGGIILSAEDVSDRVEARRVLEDDRQRLEGLVARRTAELEAANDALLQRSEALADLYDRAPCGYFSVDDQRRIVEVNRTMLTLLGYSHDEMLGRPLREFLTADSVARHERKFGEDLPSSVVHEEERDFVRRDGAVLPVLLSGEIDRDVDGRIVAARATIVDDRERRRRRDETVRLNEELGRRATEAESAMRARSTFLANMSHEIRTPMNAILGLSHLMSRGDRPPADLERLGKIDAAARRLLGLLNDILDVSNIEVGRMNLAIADFDVHDVVGRAAELMRAQAAEKGLELSVDLGTLPPRARGDATRLLQALANLLTNAVKFTERGSIRVRGMQVDSPEAGTADEATWLMRFEVEDTGPGIPLERQGALFEPFVQADDSTTRRHGGTGLGLVLTREIARLMGGDAGMRSAPGAGSSFWFTVRMGRLAAEAAPVPVPAAVPVQVPVALHAPTPTPTPPPAASAETRLRRGFTGRHILVVEDNPVNREVAELLLRDAGLEVDAAEDGAHAVAMARPGHHDLVLMDLQMPVLDGLGAARALRAKGATMPIVAMTANVSDEDRANALAAGMDDHIAKPVDPQRLYELLLHWLPLSAGRRASPSPG